MQKVHLTNPYQQSNIFQLIKIKSQFTTTSNSKFKYNFKTMQMINAKFKYNFKDSPTFPEDCPYPE
jgi:hypothetical protein